MSALTTLIVDGLRAWNGSDRRAMGAMKYDSIGGHARPAIGQPNDPSAPLPPAVRRPPPRPMNGRDLLGHGGAGAAADALLRRQALLGAAEDEATK
jgi:hypothetical protein